LTEDDVLRRVAMGRLKYLQRSKMNVDGYCGCRQLPMLLKVKNGCRTAVSLEGDTMRAIEVSEDTVDTLKLSCYLQI